MRGFEIAATLLSMTPAAGPSPYASDARIQYVQQTLEAFDQVNAAQRQRAYDYVYAMERKRCQAPLESLKIGCLLEVAKKRCKTASFDESGCRRIMDVIITNRLNAPRFISKRLRFEIISANRDYRPVLYRQLMRRYAGLTTEMHMAAAPETPLSNAIDAYCQRVSGPRALSWQGCVAAIVWFVKTSGTGS